MSYEFEVLGHIYIADFYTPQLTRGGETIAVPPNRPWRLLKYLLENQNRFIKTEELISAVWGKEVGDGSLSNAITTLREIFKATKRDTGAKRDTAFIGNKPYFGYRLLPQINKIDETSSESERYNAKIKLNGQASPGDIIDQMQKATIEFERLPSEVIAAKRHQVLDIIQKLILTISRAD